MILFSTWMALGWFMASVPIAVAIAQAFCLDEQRRRALAIMDAS